jgi:flagellar biosynthesis/type III secretory pathway protein FliH
MSYACNYPKAATTELDEYILQLADKENEHRDELTKRYMSTADEKEVEAYEKGFADGYQAGSQDGWAKGFDEGLKQAKKEEEQEGD